jgi:uncharacterized protein YodC (DUF2158 family)
MEHAQVIQPGVEVKLRSGGPWMVVQARTHQRDGEHPLRPSGTYAVCYWFDADQVLQEATFHIESLVVGVGGIAHPEGPPCEGVMVRGGRDA